MTQLIKLAIIVPCYNYGDYVGEAIASVTSQLRNDCELIVIDDGSTDGSWGVISDAGVRAVRMSNGGAIGACVAGLDLTTAPHVLFLDADDKLKPGALDAILSRLDPEVAKLQFALTRIDARGEWISGAVPALDDYREREALAVRVAKTGVYRSPPTSGNVFRRDVADLIREIDYERSVDGVLLYAAPFTGDVVSVSEELGCYRVHGRNVANTVHKSDAVGIRNNVERFIKRMEHLKIVARRLGWEGDLFDPHDVFVTRERKFYLEVVSGRRPSLSCLVPLLVRLTDERLKAKNKLGLAALFVLAAVLPNGRATMLIKYRSHINGRSAAGFLRKVVATTAVSSNT